MICIRRKIMYSTERKPHLDNFGEKINKFLKLTSLFELLPRTLFYMCYFPETAWTAGWQWPGECSLCNVASITALRSQSRTPAPPPCAPGPCAPKATRVEENCFARPHAGPLRILLGKMAMASSQLFFFRPPHPPGHLALKFDTRS